MYWMQGLPHPNLYQVGWPDYWSSKGLNSRPPARQTNTYPLELTDWVPTYFAKCIKFGAQLSSTLIWEEKKKTDYKIIITINFSVPS